MTVGWHVFQDGAKHQVTVSPAFEKGTGRAVKTAEKVEVGLGEGQAERCVRMCVWGG